MSRKFVLAAIGASLLSLTFLSVASYGATGLGLVAGVVRITLVAVLSYLVMKGRGWAAALLAIWLAVTAVTMVVGAAMAGNAGGIVASVAFAIVLLASAIVLALTWRRGVVPDEPDSAGPPDAS